MSEIQINGKLRMTVPEGCHEMTEEERNGLKVLEEGPWIGLSDPQRHLLISLGWKELGGLTAKLVNDQDLAAQTEKHLAKALQPMGYRLIERPVRSIAGQLIQGIRYEYQAQGTEMAAESFAAKRGKAAYYFHLYTRAALLEENLSVWEKALASLEAYNPER